MNPAKRMTLSRGEYAPRTGQDKPPRTTGQTRALDTPAQPPQEGRMPHGSYRAPTSCAGRCRGGPSRSVWTLEFRGRTWGLCSTPHQEAGWGTAAKRGEIFEERRERTINPRSSSVNGTFVDAGASAQSWRASSSWLISMMTVIAGPARAWTLAPTFESVSRNALREGSCGLVLSSSIPRYGLP